MTHSEHPLAVGLHFGDSPLCSEVKNPRSAVKYGESAGLRAILVALTLRGREAYLKIARNFVIPTRADLAIRHFGT